MREREYPPLLASGFSDIAEADLHEVFVKPFTYGAEDHRNNLVIDFIRFLKEFKTIRLPAEVWIDGSFATHAPDPFDVDVVFYFDPRDVDALEGETKAKFERLFQSRKFILGLYKVEVHYAVKGNEADYAQWQRTFGTFYDNETPKGIFRLNY